MSKTLVAYFSAEGNTKVLAKTISDVVKGDIFEIAPTEKYTSADLNWHNKSSRSSVEMQDKASRPTIADKVENMDQYDTVFVGFPIWWYEAPRIVQTLLLLQLLVEVVWVRLTAFYRSLVQHLQSG